MISTSSTLSAKPSSTTTSQVYTTVTVLRSGQGPASVPVKALMSIRSNEQAGYPVYEPSKMFNYGNIAYSLALLPDPYADTRMAELYVPQEGQQDWRTLVKQLDGHFVLDLDYAQATDSLVKRLDQMTISANQQHETLLRGQAKATSAVEANFPPEKPYIQGSDTAPPAPLMDASNYSAPWKKYPCTASQAVPRNVLYPGPSSIQMSMAIYDDEVIVVPGGFAPPNPGITSSIAANNEDEMQDAMEMEEESMSSVCLKSTSSSSNAPSEDWIVMSSDSSPTPTNVPK